jgi:hypothetical protein
MKSLAEQHPEVSFDYPDYYVYEYEVAEYDTIDTLRQISPEDVVFFSWDDFGSAVRIITKKKRNVREFAFHLEDYKEQPDIRDEDICTVFPLFKAMGKVGLYENSEWAYIPFGLQHWLAVRKDIFEDFEAVYNNELRHRPFQERLFKWRKLALLVLNRE